jgi:hypothetical protein
VATVGYTEVIGLSSKSGEMHARCDAILAYQDKKWVAKELRHCLIRFGDINYGTSEQKWTTKNTPGDTFLRDWEEAVKNSYLPSAIKK